MMVEDTSVGQMRERLVSRALASASLVANMTTELVRVPSETPPSDTMDVREVVIRLLDEIPSINIRLHMSEPPVANLVATLKGARPGRRIVLSGHLDTYPAGSPERWSANPFDGRIEDGFLYGRGSCDMKGGIAASIMAMKLIADEAPDFAGEIVLALAGDEEAMGERGTQALIDMVPECRADAVIVPDVGSPRVIRIGEKGMIWLRLQANGKSSHGAHVHRGINAVDALISAILALKGLEGRQIDSAHEAVGTMAQAQAISEPLGGEGEMDVMSRVTVNVGCVHGGTSPNLVPEQASAELDIRIPSGVSVASIEEGIVAILSEHPRVSMEIIRRYEASWTPVSELIVQTAVEAAKEILAEPIAVNMRVGASDARLWRRAGIPTIVCGLTPYNLGAPDEKLDVSELPKLTALLTLTVYDFLEAKAK